LVLHHCHHIFRFFFDPMISESKTYFLEWSYCEPSQPAVEWTSVLLRHGRVFPHYRVVKRRCPAYTSSTNIYSTFQEKLRVLFSFGLGGFMHSWGE
jgi:hypothetical protein